MIFLNEHYGKRDETKAKKNLSNYRQVIKKHL